ncbi:MAG: HlyD family efflux transporter periplasmic adaptor subunit [Phycisphaerales bacterium]|nr:HlyD family efflux transporter periplasmic adaptor subunit [Phycisphaerales bacterium]
MSSSQVVESQTNQGSSGEVIRTTPTKASRSQLVARLTAAQDSLPGFINDLLTTQAVSVVGTEAAAFVIERNQTSKGPQGQVLPFSLRPIAHMRPDDSSDDVRQQALEAFKELIVACVEQDKDGAVEISVPEEAGPERQFCLITLLKSEGSSVAVTAAITRCADDERARQRLMSMQLVAGYFELYGMRRQNETTKHTIQRQTRALQLVNSVADSDGFQAAAAGLCNEMAQRTGANRVSIGWLKGENVRLKAISHTEKFDKKQELVVQLEHVMDECLDQEQLVRFHPSAEGSATVTRQAQALSRMNGGQAIISLPLRRKSEVVGIMTLEFDPSVNLDEDAAAALSVAADLVAPSLWDRYQNDRWLITKAGLSLKNLGHATVGPKYMITKVIVGAVVLALIFICIYSPMYKVSAPFNFVPLVKRDVAAPVEGYISEYFVRPGDKVTAGQVLAKLKVTELEAQKYEAQTQANAYLIEANAARNQAKQADADLAMERRKLALIKMDYFQRQIDKHTITAPIDGEVLRGDLKDKIGSPVKMGDVMFEIGQQTPLEAELEVAERDIQQVKVGQKGYLATTSLPNQEYPFVVTRVVPVGEPSPGGGDNVFKVYATMQKEDGSWAPGRSGEARVEIEKRPLVYHWTHRLVEWIQLKFWL